MVVAVTAVASVRAHARAVLVLPVKAMTLNPASMTAPHAARVVAMAAVASATTTDHAH